MLTRSSAALSILAILCSAEPVSAQQVGARQYTVADNLVDNRIEAIHQDSRGYIWFATQDGLSRFDGYGFTNYRVEDGLPTRRVRDVAEDARGQLWVATSGGLARLVEQGRDRPGAARFTHVDAGAPDTRPAALLAHPDGALWSVTPAGIIRGRASDAGALAIDRVSAEHSGGVDPRLFRDREGRVWVMLDRKLIVFGADGQELARFGAEHGVGRSWIVSVSQDRAGRMYAANENELFALDQSNDLRSARWQRLPLALPGTTNAMRWIAFDSSDRLWIGTFLGVLWWRDGAVSELSFSAGPSARVEVGLVDRQGNVWIGTIGQGVFRISAELVLSYTQREGLPAGQVTDVFEDADGRIYAATEMQGWTELTAGRAVPVPGAQTASFTAQHIRAARDAQGHWWLGTAPMTGRADLFWMARGPADFTRARLVWSAPAHPVDASWTGPWLSRLQDGTVLVGASRNRVFKATYKAGVPELELLAGLEGFDNVRHGVLDRAGNIWLAGVGQLGRWASGSVETITRPGSPLLFPRSPIVDSRGWLWVASGTNGVAVSRNPEAREPKFDFYSMTTGLSSNDVRAVAEDNLGRVYFGTSRGLDRLDPATGVIRHFGTHEGLAGATVMSIMADHLGRIWVSTTGGVSLIERDRSAPLQPVPPTYVTRVAVAGNDRAVPERGARQLPALHLGSDEDNLVVDWVAISQASDVPLRYQYRLAGYDRDWSAQTTNRSVTYAGLGAGTYRFEVRAVDAGTHSEGAPASLSFTVDAPFWARPWFILVTGLAVAGAGASVHRLRLRQALAMERLRRQVAFDLHDDVGSGLSEIAILSELAQTEKTASSEIAPLARTLRESMGDIVWAVDPRHDSLGELVQRMRQVANNLLEAQGLAVSFVTPVDPKSLDRIDMAPDRRRNVLLVFKEAVHNVAKHARARHVAIAITLASQELTLSVEDDGCGFDAGIPGSGHGLTSLRRRAEALGATLLVRSAPGAGTRVELNVPID